MLTFLHARTIFFKSYSDESPCTVVKVLRPFRCWILICTRPSWTSSSEPLIASAKGSAKRKTEQFVSRQVVYVDQTTMRIQHVSRGVGERGGGHGAARHPRSVWPLATAIPERRPGTRRNIDQRPRSRECGSRSGEMHRAAQIGGRHRHFDEAIARSDFTFRQRAWPTPRPSRGTPPAT